MSFPLPFRDQYECRGETLEVYASDRRGLVEYKFNNLGYRNSIDYCVTESNAGVYLGSSITSGIGISWEKTFVKLSSDFLAVQPYHFSQGCTKIDNYELLQQVTTLIKSNFLPKYWVIQFIDLDRQFDKNTGICNSSLDTAENIRKFIDIFSTIESLLCDKTWCFIGCDNLSHAIPDHIRHHDNCISWNPRFIDQAGVGTHPGTKWHQMISLGIQKSIKSKFLSIQR
jgi:hypothetical protein